MDVDWWCTGAGVLQFQINFTFYPCNKSGVKLNYCCINNLLCYVRLRSLGLFTNSIRKSLNVISVKYQLLMNRPNRFYWSFLPGLSQLHCLADEQEWAAGKPLIQQTSKSRTCPPIAPLLEFAFINSSSSSGSTNTNFHKPTSTTSFIEVWVARWK